jgi:hypothetical protein
MTGLAWIAALLLLAADTATAQPAPPSAPATITVHRCVDAAKHVTLQDEPCPPGTEDTRKVMQRPQDEGAAPPPPKEPAPAPEPEPEPVIAPAPKVRPPPMFVCTSYDGIQRYSESYDPNPRCEPLGLYYPPQYLTPKSAQMCRWVEDSCVQLNDAQACAVWEDRRKEAESSLQQAFSDTAAYRKSELERITQIVNRSCR